MFNHAQTSRLALRLGFWSALFSALALVVFTVCFTVVLTVNPIFMWTNLADYMAYTRAYPSIFPDVARLAMLIFGSLFVLLLNSIHEYARDEHKLLTRVSLCFGLAFAVLTGVHYFVQLSAVRLATLKGDVAGLEQIVQANPYSGISAMNMLGWTFFLGIASLAVAPVFGGGRLESVIRSAFLVNGACCILGGIGYMLENVPLVFLTINLGMGGALTVSTIALTVLFKRLEKSARVRLYERGTA